MKLTLLYRIKYGVRVLVLCCASYLLGSFNFAMAVAWLVKRIDLRDYYDGNPGATNVYITVGKFFGILVGVLDALKGFIPLFAACKLGITGTATALVGVCSIIGHDFSIFYSFKGGTGIAATIGGLFYFDPVFTIVIVTISLMTTKYLCKKGYALSGFTPFETVEVFGFLVSIAYIFMFSKNLIAKIYFLMVLATIVARQLPKVRELMAKHAG